MLLGLVVYAFSLAVISQAQSNSQELHNASIAIVDEDHSELSRRIAQAFLPPLFQTPQPIAERDIVPADECRPIHLRRRHPAAFRSATCWPAASPAIQIDVDATAMVQAGLGSGYAQQIIGNEISGFPLPRGGRAAVDGQSRRADRLQPQRHDRLVHQRDGIINNVTMLAIILAGAAVVREREHGTMDHLLVMPLTPFEIAMSKIWANGLVITVAVGLSLYFVVRMILGSRSPARSRCSWSAS